MQLVDADAHAAGYDAVDYMVGDMRFFPVPAIEVSFKYGLVVLDDDDAVYGQSFLFYIYRHVIPRIRGYESGAGPFTIPVPGTGLRLTADKG